MHPLKKLAMSKILKYASGLLYLLGFGFLVNGVIEVFIINLFVSIFLFIGSIAFDWGFIGGVIKGEHKPKVLPPPPPPLELSPIPPPPPIIDEEEKPKRRTLYKPEFIMHYLTKSNDRERYLCNYASKVTLGKVTKTKKMVTCKNCLKIMKRDGII